MELWTSEQAYISTKVMQDSRVPIMEEVIVRCLDNAIVTRIHLSNIYTKARKYCRDIDRYISLSRSPRIAIRKHTLVENKIDNPKAIPLVDMDLRTW